LAQQPLPVLLYNLRRAFGFIGAEPKDPSSNPVGVALKELGSDVDILDGQFGTRHVSLANSNAAQSSLAAEDHRVLPPADDVREKVLTLLRDRGGRVEIREIRSALGFVELDPQNALANPVHAALTALRDAGEIVSHEPTWGDPSFKITPECYSEPNLHQERREARIGRYEEKASIAHSQAESRFNTAREMADGIPFGQPILVGHHSEKSDRRYRDRIHDNFDKAVELENKATHYSEKASAAESNRAITSDDPTAVSELRTKLKSRATLQAYMKAINSGIRKAALDTLPKDDVRAKLTEIIASVCPDDGEGKALLQKLLNNAQDSTYGLISPPHELTNNNAQIRRLKERIAELEKANENETTKTCHGVCTLVEDADENRVRLIFPGKPDELTREVPKSENFRWSRTNGAWQRQLNSAGRVAAKRADVAQEQAFGGSIRLSVSMRWLEGRSR
jgi:hypothetical protein